MSVVRQDEAVGVGSGGRVAVVGSLNADLAVAVNNRPQAGETVLGSDLVERAGGKGANQAVAAARVGAEVAMVGRVGDDARAELLLSALRDAGVDIDAVEAIAGEASGCALITVTPDGDNAIVVAPGANAKLSAGDIERHGDLLRAAAVVVCQLEIPLEAVDATARELAEDALLVVNAAPPADLSPPLLERTDVLVVNAPELRGVAGGVGLDVDAPEHELVTGLLGHGPRAVLATLGADGALLGHGDECVALPARPVEVVDTTGAGDATVGALAAALAAGLTLEEAARAAVAAGTAAITAPGAQPPLPALADLH